MRKTGFEDLLEEDEKEDTVRKKRVQIILLIFEVIIVISCGIFLMYIMQSTVSDIAKNTATDKPKVSFNTSKPKTDKPLYVVTPGYTYYVDKGKIKLYADVIPMSTDKLFIIGKLFHEDKELEDAFIKESFSKQEDNSFINNTNDITVIYGDTTVSIEDSRGVSLQFDGNLSLVEEAEHNDIEGEYVEEIVEEVKSENDIEASIDEYSIENTPEDFVSTKFTDYLNSSYEQKDITIVAKYIESTTNSGTKYQELYTGTYFYAFGSPFPYDSNSCDTVTITATYRGTESRFNGLSMDTKYPCFVIKSIRKQNENELSQKVTH